MQPKEKIVSCFFLLLLVGYAGYSQFKFEKPVVIGHEQGFRYNAIKSVRKGNDGFIWMASSDGICRFDGQLIRIFKLTADFNQPPYDNSVLAVLPVDDHIWAGTTQGISVMNSKDHSFRHYQFTEKGKTLVMAKRVDQHVSVLYRDKKGRIWLGTRSHGVAVYDEAKDDFRFYQNSAPNTSVFPLLGDDKSILSLEESKTNDSILWAGTPGGLQEINKYTGQVTLHLFPQVNKDYQVALNAFRRLYHHDDGLLYVGSWAAGVNVFDPVKKTFRPIQLQNENARDMVSKVIGNICRKSDHEMWITSMAGLAIYDTRKKDVTWYKYNNSVENEFYAVDYIDEANRVWHTNINGLQYYDPVMQQFAVHSFKHLSGPDWAFAFYILSDKTGNKITVCPRVTDGLYHFDRSSKKWTKSYFAPEATFKFEKDAIRGFVRLPSGEYVISADRGIFVYSEKTGKISMLRDQLPFSPTRRGDILLDRANNLWIADDAMGLIKWKPGTRQYKIYKTRDAKEGMSFAARLADLFEDSQGNIWFQRQGGFGVYVAARDSIISFIYEKNPSNSFAKVYSFAEDRNGHVWLSGDDNWLGYALSREPEKGVVHKKKQQNGAPAYLPGMATDANGDVWGYTASELFKINADDLSFTTYSFQYGINEVDYFHFSFLPSGEMIFGGRNDIVIANPAELVRNKEIPVPYVDDIQVLNRPFHYASNGSPLSLNYSQNFFSIGFSAKAFTMARDVRFRYRLKGFDDWTESRSKGFANYTNVPGGEYVFQLMAANNEGVWSERMLELPVHIAIPWWKTWWFRTLLGLAVVALAVWIYRYRVAQIRKKEQLRSQYEKKLANVEMSALLAQMNPHFLFNSLNSIDSYIIRNESKQASEYLNNFARLMRLILQNSRSNYITLKDEIEALDLYLQMESLRFARRFDYEIRLSPDIDSASVLIPPMLIQPYVENAIWHGLMHQKNGSPGKVEILISKKEESLYCVIQDNGIGREKAEALKAQKHGTHKRSMGMQITRDRIEMINKLYSSNTTMQVIDLHDETGNAAGTRVELVIPF